MSNEYDTPRGLEPDSKDVNDWVRFQLIRILDRIKGIEGKMVDVCAKNLIYDEFITSTKVRLAEGVQTFQNIDARLLSIDEQIKELRAMRVNPKKENSNAVTFKYLVDKLALPIVTSVITAIIIAALMYWILNA